MAYPKYPTPITSNIKPEGWNGKLRLEQMLDLTHEFQALDLYPVPKRAGDKIAHWKFWMKRDGHVPLEVNDENLRLYLPNSDIDGLILSVGKSRNGRLVVLDLDPAGDHRQAEITYEEIQALSPTGFVVATPSNGLHLYYILPEGVPALKPTVHVHWSNLDIRAKNSLIGLPGSFQQYTDKAEKKGVEYGHVGYYRRLKDDPGADYSNIPVMSEKLYQLLYEAQNPVKATDATDIGANNYEQSPEALARIEAHLKRPIEVRERLVLELLGHVLKDWKGKNYDQWLQMWMAAHHGSSGSEVVRDYIAGHPMVWTGRPQSEVETFRSTWDAHQPQPDGYTVASLMYLGRQAGWLQTTGLEIPKSAMTEIDVQYIQEWTAAQETLPDRVLVMSQTGSGKTYNISYLYKRLGEPKTVIFVPTTKLATELANTLKSEHGLPVTLYVDASTGRTKDAEVLVKAKILVTTLQTFGNKVHKAVPMSRYGLVYFEESDQLFQQFGRGGGGAYASHVKETEARAGFAVIRDAFENSGNVWCVDATMTQVTHFVATQMKGDHEITVIRNNRVQPKATVRMLEDKGEAYQVILASLLGGKRVVVAADTAQVAEEVVKTMEAIGALEGKTSLLITSHTERNSEVRDFMEDVNAGAQKYDLLAYNSVMASGVSITSVTPDVIVQIATYLTPRVNLQLLNRYRKQSEVYVFYQDAETLYADTDLTVLTEAYRRAGLEAELVNMPLAERVPDATVRAKVASMSVGDETLQRRSARDFYRGLLQRDGREVVDAEPIAQTSLVDHTLKAVRIIKKDMKEHLRMTWHETRPINRDDPADPDMTDLEVAQGEIHAKIQAALRGHIPKDVPPEEIYDMVQSFQSSITPLSAFVHQGFALKQAESYLADEGRAITTLSNNITLIQILTTVHMLYPSLDSTLTSDALAERAPTFVRMLQDNKEAYNAVINRGNQKFDEVYNRSDNDVDRAVDYAKILLAKVGLHQRTAKGSRAGGNQTYEYRIENATDAERFLAWRYPKEDLSIEFNDTPIRTIINARGAHIKIFQAMTEAQKSQVMRLLNDERFTDFPTAVEAVLMGEKF